jgi:transposase
MPKTPSKIRAYNRRQKFRAEERRAEVVSLVKAGKSGPEIARDLGVDRKTIWRDVHALQSQFQCQNAEQYASHMNEALAKNQLQEKTFLEGRLPAADMMVWLAITKERNAILGSYAPDKSVSLSVSGSPDQLIGYRRFVKETSYLNAEQLEQVFAFARTLNIPPARVDHQPPASSELWDEPKQLTEGEAE